VNAPPSIASRSHFLNGTLRVFELSLGQMLWSRRTLFMVIVAGVPVVLALVLRLALSAGMDPLRINGLRIDGAGLFSLVVWLVFVRFVIPVLGVFYGTALIADEVEDKTLTYLFTRPIRRAAVLAGKYLAYLACTASVVLPAVILVFFLLVPFREIAGAALPFAKDIGVLALGLAAYGGLFSLAGALLRRPLVAGLVFAFGWEQIAMPMPGYLKQLTIGYYLQALVPHTAPTGNSVVLFQGGGVGSPSPAVSLFWLITISVVAVAAAARTVERREYVLEQ